jgi:hypothetical protein
MRQKQRDLISMFLMDLANLAAVALGFGQFLTVQPFNKVALGSD